MTEWVGRLGTFLAVGLCLAGVAPGCGKETVSTGDNSETHFLATCESECGGGLECICGVCTKRCTETDGCGSLNDDASCADSCGDVATKVCDVACSDSTDCSSLGSQFGCYSGHCRTQADDVSGSGGGAAGASSARPGGNGNGGAPEAPVGNCQSSPDLTPELVPNSQLDADVMARAAVVVGSCLPDDGIARNLSAMWSANIAARVTYHLNVVQARCLADSRCGCEAVTNCLGYKVETEVAADCQSSCDGSVFRGCGEGVDLSEGLAVSIDCSKYGQSCSLDHLWCVDGAPMACDGTEPATCRAGAPPLYCSQGVLLEGPDCEALGLGCADGQCQGTGAECVNQNFPNQERLVEYEGVSCQGGVLEACVVGKLASLNCTEQGPGFDCQTVDGVPFCGLASECLPGSAGVGTPYPTTCDGTRVDFCNAGRIEALDCLDLGFSGCDAETGLRGCTPSLGEL